MHLLQYTKNFYNLIDFCDFDKGIEIVFYLVDDA